jgi:hypothetical protein
MAKMLHFGIHAHRWSQPQNAQLDVSGLTVPKWSQSESITAHLKTCLLTTLSSRDAPMQM